MLSAVTKTLARKLRADAFGSPDKVDGDHVGSSFITSLFFSGIIISAPPICQYQENAQAKFEMFKSKTSRYFNIHIYLITINC